MNSTIKLLYALLISVPVLFGCASGDDAFSGTSGSSSSNIITDNNFAVFFDEPNPAVLDDDGYHGGVAVVISIQAADKDDLPVNGGTVYVKTEWGVLDANSCQLVDGTCTVTWTSSSDFAFIPPDLYNAVTVYAQGEESFSDLDGDGSFSDGDIWLRDIPEPFLDLFDSITLVHDYMYTPGTDEIIDIDGDGLHTPADNLYNGSNCTHSSLCPIGTPSSIMLFDIGYMNLDARTPPDPALSVTIDAPANLSSFASGANVTFTATATDPEDGTILGANNPIVGNDIVWSSDLDGPFGVQANSTTVNTLSVGSHIITVTVTDSDGNTVSASIAITIT